MELTTGKAHPEFDFRTAQRIFAKNDSLSGQQIASPFSLYSVETLRDHHRLRNRAAFETDIFVWGIGRPKQPHLTKVSGLPYLPKNIPWPTDDDGEPLQFLAQFFLGDSRDLLPTTPGDLLSLFVPANEDWLSEPSKIRFEWLTVRPESLVQQFPRGIKSYSANEWYGVIYRSHDYPEAEAREEIRGGLDLPILNGTKIGGIPHGIQSSAEFEIAATTNLPQFPLETNFGMSNATFLGQLTSIQARSSVPFPWSNREDPYDLSYGSSGIYHKDHQCTFGDMGSIYIYLLDDGECAAIIEDY